MQTIRLFAGTLFLTTSLLAGTVVAAQAPKVARPPAPAAPALTDPPRIDDQNARDTRDHLNRLLTQYPPSLREVLKLDPMLLGNRDYLAFYPGLDEFLTQHPEVAHNPTYFVGGPGYSQPNEDPKTQVIEMWRSAMEGLVAFLSMSAVILLLAWLVKTLIDHKRWQRMTKTQADAHTKLLDRFTSNEDLLAYIQTPAGKHFLESGPIPTDMGSQAVGAPVGRILWSVQAGVVLLFVGGGLHFAVPQNVFEGIAQPLSVISVLAIALGLGFIMSGAVSYVISQRLGLFSHDRQEPSQT